MARVHQQVKGVKWHVNASGQVTPCNASKRACPYTHYDTEVDASDKRIRAVKVDSSTGLIGVYEHEISMAGGKFDASAGESLNSLRKLSDKARERYVQTGKRLRFPRGSLTVDFGLGNKLKVVKEDFPVHRPDGVKKVGSRYVMTYWHSPTEYETSKIEMKPDDIDPQYKLVQGQLQTYFNMARDKNTERFSDRSAERGIKIDPVSLDEATPNYDEAIKTGYLTTLKIFDQIEILSRGAKNAHQDLGIDLFSKDKPGLLELDVDCQASVFQPYDVVESLQFHAMTDDEPKKIAIHVSDKTKDGDGSWSISRIPEGSWFFSYEHGEDTFSQEINVDDAANARESVVQVLGPRLAPEVRNSRIDLVHSMITDVEPAIRNYERTVESRNRTIAGEQKSRVRHESAEEPKSMRDKLFGMFS